MSKDHRTDNGTRGAQVKRRRWLWSVGLLLSAGLLGWLLRPRPLEVELAQLRIGRF